jgi:hypothetical protein
MALPLNGPLISQDLTVRRWRGTLWVRKSPQEKWPILARLVAHYEPDPQGQTLTTPSERAASILSYDSSVMMPVSCESCRARGSVFYVELGWRTRAGSPRRDPVPHTPREGSIDPWRAVAESGARLVRRAARRVAAMLRRPEYGETRYIKRFSWSGSSLPVAIQSGGRALTLTSPTLAISRWVTNAFPNKLFRMGVTAATARAPVIVNLPYAFTSM